MSDNLPKKVEPQLPVNQIEKEPYGVDEIHYSTAIDSEYTIDTASRSVDYRLPHTPLALKCNGSSLKDSDDSHVYAPSSLEDAHDRRGDSQFLMNEQGSIVLSDVIKSESHHEGLLNNGSAYQQDFYAKQQISTDLSYDLYLALYSNDLSPDLQGDEADSNGGDASWLTMTTMLVAGGIAIGGLGYWFYKKQNDDDKKTESLTDGLPEVTDDLRNNTTETLNEVPGEKAIDDSLKPDDPVDADNDVIVITGRVTLGPVVDDNGLSVQILSNAGDLLTEAVVDSKGEYEASIKKMAGVIKAKVIDKDDSPDYMDEATGALKDVTAPLLSVITITSEEDNTVMNINPVTTIVSRVLGMDSQGRGNTVTTDAVKAANDQVAKSLFNEVVDIARYDVEPIIDKAGNSVDGNKGGVVLAIISSLEDKNNQTTEQVIQQLVDGFEDKAGEQLLSDASVEMLQEATVHLSTTMGTEAITPFREQMTGIAASNKVTINFAPTVDQSTVTLDEDTVYAFKVSDFMYSDHCCPVKKLTAS